eukprot:1990311-Pleurochrysis_carterae.AAC.1
MPPPPKFAIPRNTIGQTAAKRPLPRTKDNRDEASHFEDRRRDAPRREASRRYAPRREKPPRHTRTPKPGEQHQSRSPTQSKKQRRSISPTQSDQDGSRDRKGDEGGRTRERRVGAMQVQIILGPRA